MQVEYIHEVENDQNKYSIYFPHFNLLFPILVYLKILEHHPSIQFYL